jgi:hypothetical protein
VYCGSLSFSITSISFPTCKFNEACIGLDFGQFE